MFSGLLALFLLFLRMIPWKAKRTLLRGHVVAKMGTPAMMVSARWFKQYRS
jgi:hypothetical protein